MLRRRRPPRILPSLSLLLSLACRTGAAPPILGTLPGFSLVDQRGRTVSRETLAGRPWVADFIFTRCGGICPAMTARMTRLRKDVDPAVAFVSFTVDPENDTPEVLGRYAREAGVTGSWLFVTGPAGALYDLSVKGFKLSAEAVPASQQEGGDGPFLHSSKFVLVDGEGGIRGYYDSTDEQALRALVADAAAVRAER